LTGKENLVELG